MSNLLEQAIIDAKTLKMVAEKNAEETLIEKYSSKLKEAVEKILMDEEEVERKEEEPKSEDEKTIDSAEEAPYAVSSDEEEEVEIDFSEIEKQLKAMEEEDLESNKEEEVSREETIENLPVEENHQPVETSEDVEEDELEKIIEELIVDIVPVPSGYSASNNAERKDVQDIMLAKMNDDESKEEQAKLNKIIDDLAKTVDSKQNEILSLREENEKNKRILSVLKDKISEVNLSNLKLVYQNKALSSASMNERQKSKIVEAIYLCDSSEKVKIIYETLLNSIENNSKNVSFNNLNEALPRSNTILPFNSEKTPKTNAEVERMKKLAGINKN